MKHSLPKTDELRFGSPLERRRISIKKPTAEHVLSHFDESDGHKSSCALPNLFQRVWSIVPFVEMMGFLKDHRKAFKASWIEAHHR